MPCGYVYFLKLSSVTKPNIKKSQKLVRLFVCFYKDIYFVHNKAKSKENKKKKKIYKRKKKSENIYFTLKNKKKSKLRKDRTQLSLGDH